MDKPDFSSDYFKSVFQFAPNAQLIVDANLTILSANQAALTLAGYSESKLDGEPLNIIFADNEQLKEEQWLADLIKLGTVFNAEKKLKPKDGPSITIQFSASRLTDKSESCAAIICSIYDISHIKQNAERAADVKADYLARMSHEIRTHMNTVTGMTNLLLETGDLDSDYREYVEAVQKSATWLSTMANDFLDYSKIGAGKLRLESMDFDLRPAIEGIKILLNQSAKEKGVKLACIIHSNLPSVVRGDPWRIRQILINLTSNAINFTEEGKILIVASLAGSSGSHTKVRFEVSDTGKGIPADLIDLLFKPYSQTHNAEFQNKGGTGLGLAISKDLCELMGGEIGVKSKEGEGSTFWFEVSLEKSEDTSPMIPLSLDQVKKLNVMAFVDKEVNSKALTHYFNTWGCNHDCVMNMDDLLEKLRQAAQTSAEYHLLLVDVSSPDDSVETLAKNIKSDPLTQKLRLILMTATAKRGDAKRMEDAGFEAFLTKPIGKDLLFDCIAAVMGFHKISENGKGVLITRHSLTERTERNRARILLVEDDVVNQMLVVNILENAGFHVDVSNNGKEAITSLQSQFYDTVLMDCQMPEMDGFETTVEIRKLDGYAKHAPIIALTAEIDNPETRDKYIKTGMDDYLFKPFENKDLINIINKWIDDDAEFDVNMPDVPEMTAENVFNMEAALKHADNDLDFLRKLIKQFIDDNPVKMDKIKNSIGNKDAKALTHAVHAIKGTLGNLYAGPAFDAALKLEKIGFSGNIEMANEGLKELETEIDRLKLEFTTILAL